MIAGLFWGELHTCTVSLEFPDLPKTAEAGFQISFLPRETPKSGDVFLNGVAPFQL